MTRILPPLLPGKIVFTWTDLAVNEREVVTRGTFVPAERSPSVTMRGPTAVRIEESLGAASARYGLNIYDLRPPLVIQWSGASPIDSNRRSARAQFFRAGQTTVRATVTDSDGQTATDEIRVRASIHQLEPGQHPF